MVFQNSRPFVAGLAVLALVGCRQDSGTEGNTGGGNVAEAAQLDEREGQTPSQRAPGAQPQPREEKAQAHPDTDVEKPVSVNLGDVRWQAGPDALPRGARMAVLEGTPPLQAPETFTFLLRFPPNYTIPPHSHVVTERVTVLSGSLSFAHGEKPDRRDATLLEQGGLALIPAGHVHTAFTGDQEAVIALQGVGPWGIWYVNPKDDPRGAKAPPKPTVTHDFDARVQPTFVNADEVEYGPPPPGLLPEGAQMAILEGDPGKPQTFLLRLKIPDGYRFPVHTHGVTDRPIVIRGALRLGIGGQWRDAAMQTLRPGAVGVLPEGLEHYAAARGETEFQVWGVGPFDIQWKDPKDAPRPTAKK